ncbi:hypothetical protein OHD62_20720 [Mesorhizobium sp. YC-39]|uniref:hypothetical protein n=1 Tax=unclassified Mesorhizobium TaxID=325217 RepID=UPI0021E6EB69|nr:MULTISPECIES: hypothetical protein [unclassified Mesorhizobium]MCV3210267.1 hypothetical protein [Mesorhizobium sp. YC-2]MCV3230797.1 hypothetical protein [Mesorhizobium sp. YC-39]
MISLDDAGLLGADARLDQALADAKPGHRRHENGADHEIQGRDHVALVEVVSGIEKRQNNGKECHEAQGFIGHACQLSLLLQAATLKAAR